MSSPAAFTIMFAPETPAEEREALLTVLRAQHVSVQEATPKVLDWATAIAVVVDVGKLAGAGSAMIALGKQLYPFVQAARQRGTPIKGRLERPGQPPLDLEAATEQELLAWLLNNPPRP